MQGVTKSKKENLYISDSLKGILKDYLTKVTPFCESSFLHFLPQTVIKQSRLCDWGLTEQKHGKHLSVDMSSQPIQKCLG